MYQCPVDCGFITLLQVHAMDTFLKTILDTEKGEYKMQHPFSNIMCSPVTNAFTHVYCT